MLQRFRFVIGDFPSPFNWEYCPPTIWWLVGICPLKSWISVQLLYVCMGTRLLQSFRQSMPFMIRELNGSTITCVFSPWWTVDRVMTEGPILLTTHRPWGFQQFLKTRAVFGMVLCVHSLDCWQKFFTRNLISFKPFRTQAISKTKIFDRMRAKEKWHSHLDNLRHYQIEVWNRVVNGTSDACTNEPSGEGLCIRHVAGCWLKIELDLKSLVPRDWIDLMGFPDSLDGHDPAWSVVNFAL